MSSLGATSSVGKVTVIRMSMNNKPYHNEDFEDYVDDPAGSQAEATMFGQKCMTVGINDTFMPADKSNPNNLAMAQYNIRERFGYSSGEDYENDSDD